MKPRLLFLHGALGSKKQFEPLEKLLPEDFTIYTLNFEGHGGRSTDKNYSIALFTENVLEFLRENNIDKVDIFGYSMGGYVALNLAKNHPEKVGSIITLGTKFNWSINAAAKEVKMLNPAIIEEKVPKFAEILRKTHYPLDWKTVLQKTAQMMTGLANGKKMTAADLQTIQHPVTIGIGSLDKMVSIEESTHAADALAKGKLQIIDGFHHPLEKNDVNLLASYIRKAIEK